MFILALNQGAAPPTKGEKKEEKKSFHVRSGKKDWVSEWTHRCMSFWQILAQTDHFWDTYLVCMCRIHTQTHIHYIPNTYSFIHTHIHTYIHSYIHTYTHTHIHTHTEHVNEIVWQPGKVRVQGAQHVLLGFLPLQQIKPSQTPTWTVLADKLFRTQSRVGSFFHFFIFFYFVAIDLYFDFLTLPHGFSTANHFLSVKWRPRCMCAAGLNTHWHWRWRAIQIYQRTFLSVCI